MRFSPPASPGGAGGGNGGSNAPQAFATGYKPHSGDMMVYGGGAVTLVGVLAAFVNTAPSFLLASLAGTFSAFYFWPTLDTRQPQLGADVHGLYVARIGTIGWAAVRRMTVRRRALRTMSLATLVIELDPPLPEALLAGDPVPLSLRFTARNARAHGRRVEVQLHTLAMPVDAVEARLTALRQSAGRS